MTFVTLSIARVHDEKDAFISNYIILTDLYLIYY